MNTARPTPHVSQTLTKRRLGGLIAVGVIAVLVAMVASHSSTTSPLARQASARARPTPPTGREIGVAVLDPLTGLMHGGAAGLAGDGGVAAPAGHRDYVSHINHGDRLKAGPAWVWPRGYVRAEHSFGEVP